MASAAPPETIMPAEPSRGSQRRRRPRNRTRHQNPPTEQGEQGEQSEQNEQNEQTPQTPQTQQPDAQRGGRGGRGGRAGRGGPPRLPDGPAHVQTVASNAPEPTHTAPRGGRGGRGRGRGGPANAAHGRGGPFTSRVAGGRQFGGQLTVDEDIASDAARLQPDAPAFQPGQPIAPRKQRPPRAKKPQAPKSTAPDIATRTHEDIDNGHYECAICTEEVRRHSKAWSCRTCWTVFHLSCIKKWSTNEGSAAARQQAADGDLPPPRQWRCPGCNLPKDDLPKQFYCWCEKELDPKPLPGLPPFSCGQTCSRLRIMPKKCPHPCPSTCHAGPCPPCTQMGPTQYCFCTKKSITRRCIDTDYDHGWSCGDLCGELMPCGEHYCDRPCHEGLCGACEVRVPARCYCGQVQKDILCCDRGDEMDSSQSHMATDGSAAVEHWTGLFHCPNTCQRSFDCGKHKCEKECHRQDAQTPHCPRSPDVVTHCPCGKTPLAKLTVSSRQTCEDPIPNCHEPCNKLLGCGHACKQLCHQGECMPCLQTVSISCRCRRNHFSTVCHQGTEEPPQCMRVCRVSLNCGRHECGEHCCPGERKAAERKSSRRKPRPLDSTPQQTDDGFEAEHICTRSCGRQLKCGNPDHRCEELCHKGACGTCREAIFDEISCNCGRTVLQPPLPCGTKPPPCRFQCERRKECGHPQVAHTCHPDDEHCPKCPSLTSKPCLCGKNSLKNQPCWLSEVRCGEICGKRLRCGAHQCRKQCHRPGECEEPCKQACGKELSVCGHPCTSSCHSPVPCKEDKPCPQKILVTCECQRIKQEAKCNASRNSDGNLHKTLKCDDECARLERNRKLALALNVDPSAHQNDHVPYSDETLSIYRENSTWAATQEKELRVFAADPDTKRLRFKPMQSRQRKFLHSIAQDFGFDSESMDPEPHRHVIIYKTPRFVMAPMKTLAECARIRQVQRAIQPVATVPAPRPKPAMSAEPYNAFLITNPRFALTIEELNSAMKSALSGASFPLELEISFLPSEEVVLRPPPAARVNIVDRELQNMLESVKPALSQVISSQKLGKLQLARLDSSLNVLRKESDSGPGAGWSQVAAKGAPVRKLEQSAPIGTRGGFAVLSLSTKKKKAEKKADVVDDWEAAETMEEEKEKASAGNSVVPSEDEDAGSRPRSIISSAAMNEGAGSRPRSIISSAAMNESAGSRPGSVISTNAMDEGGASDAMAEAPGNSSGPEGITGGAGTTRWADMEDDESH